MALSLDLSLSDRFDEDYRQERQGAEDAALDHWWAQQVVPPQQPNDPKAGTGAVTQPGGAPMPNTGPVEPMPVGYPITKTSGLRAEVAPVEVPPTEALPATPDPSYVRSKLDQIAKDSGISDPGITEAIWQHIENKPAQVALQAVDWFFKIGNVIPSLARAVVAPKDSTIGQQYAEWVDSLPEAVKPLVPGGYDPHLKGNVQSAYNTVGTMVEVVASLQPGSDLIDYIPGLITKLGGKADEAMAILKSEEGSVTLPGGTPKPPEAQAAADLLSGTPDAPRLNMERIDASARTQRVMKAVNQLNVESGATEAALRGVVSHETTQTAAKQLLTDGTLDVQKLLDLPDGTFLAGIPPEAQALAARQIRVSSARSLADIAQRTTQGDLQAAEDIYEALALHGAIDLKVTAMSASAGRTLDIHNVAATAERSVNTRDLADVADRLRGAPQTPIPTEGLSPDILMVLAQAGKSGPAVSPTDLLNAVTMARQAGTLQEGLSPELMLLLTKAANPAPEVSAVRVAEMVLAAQQMGGRNAVDTMAQQTVKHPYANAVLEAWINGLLSGPQTHAANFTSNAMTTFWAIPERILAARLHPGTDIGVMKGEGTQMLYGLVNGFGDALSLAAKSFRTGEPASGLQKIDFSPAISAEALEMSGTVGRGVDLLGKVVRTPGRFLMASDEFFKGINYRMELHAQAFRQAAIEGLEGDAMGRRIAQIVSDPPASIKSQAEGFAAYQTFTNELGETGQAFMNFANSHPAIRVIVPFIRTPTNIFKYAMERTPLLNLVSNTVKADIKAGGARRDLALARVSMGGAVMATAATLAAQGTITGGGPQDPALRKMLQQTGWQPYSVKVGDTYYSYNRLDPVGMLLGVAANTMELSSELPKADLDQLAMAAVLGTIENLTSKTYLQGISNTLDAIRDPDQKGLNFLRSMSRSIVPAFVAQTNRSMVDTHMREVNGLLDEMRARVPGYSSSLPPRRNLWGEPILLEGGLGPDLVSPIYTNSVKDDPVAHEIIKHRVALELPVKYIGGTKPSMNPLAEERLTWGVPLTPQEYDLYVRLAGNELKANGKGLKEHLAHMITTSQYQQQSDGPDGGKAFLIRKAVQTYREAAQVELRRQSPELNDLIQERQRERIRQRLPDGNMAQGLGIAR